MDSPMRTPTKGRLSASSFEASAHLLMSPTSAGRRSSGAIGPGTPVNNNNNGPATPVRGSPRLSGSFRVGGGRFVTAGGFGGGYADHAATHHNPSAAAAMTPPDRTPTGALRDRFIPDRDSHVTELSRYLLQANRETAGSPRTPISAYGSASRGSGVGAGLAGHRSGGIGMSSPSATGAGGASSGSPASYAEPYARALTENVLADVDGENAPVVGVLPFHQFAQSGANDAGISETERYERSQAVVYETNRRRNFMSTSFRVIPQTPERILDAPDLIDDYYLNLLDWSTRNVLAVALSSALYLWDAATGDIKQLLSGDSRPITGIGWSRDGAQIAVGTADGGMSIYDPETGTAHFTVKDHTARIGTLSWNNGSVLASGSRDSSIRLYDIRAKSCIGLYQGHTQEVCGLKWSAPGTQLASGGNDNLLNVWDFNRQTRECTPSLVVTQHTAAVKALAWNPVQTHVLASGGGTADKTLKFWDVRAGELINSVDTRSQVCGAVWNKTGTEIVTSHGYSDNQLSIWKYPSLTKVTDLTGHSSRVLHLAASPDGQLVVSAAGDETIRFWRCFATESPAGAATPSRNGLSMPVSPNAANNQQQRYSNDGAPLVGGAGGSGRTSGTKGSAVAGSASPGSHMYMYAMDYGGSGGFGDDQFR